MAEADQEIKELMVEEAVELAARIIQFVAM